MKIKIQELQDFRQVFEDDHKVTLSTEEAKDAIENLTNFFDLLSEFDQEDKRKIIKREENSYAAYI